MPTVSSTLNALRVTSRSDQRLKVIVFKLQGSAAQPLYFGIHIEAVNKILGQTPIHSTRRTLASIAHLPDQDLVILDLYRQFCQAAMPEVAHVIVLRLPNQTLLGIPVQDPPLLADIVAAEIRILPDHYRRLDGLEIASHVARAETELGEVTVFMLDPALLAASLARS